MFSTHFSRQEFACRCGCNFDTVDFELVMVLEELRDHFGSPVIITSGCRCPEHNRKIGGASDSQHMKGKAADVKIVGVPAKKVWSWLNRKYPDRYGMGDGENYTHIDVRAEKKRWSYV